MEDIFIRKVGFLINSYLRMCRFKVRIINKGDVADDAQAIGKDGKFISITEMSVDIHLLGI